MSSPVFKGGMYSIKNIPLDINISVTNKIIQSKTPFIKQLPEHLNFKKASSIQEAIEFAKNVLKISKFEIENLDVANYLN